MFQRGWFLVDVPDPALARNLVELVQRYGVVRAIVAGEEHLSSARRLLAEPRKVAGGFVRIAHGDLSRIEEWRATAPGLPILALMDQPDRGMLNSLQQRGIEVAMLPVQAPNIVSFAQRALSASFLPHAGVSRMVAHLAQTRKLSAREVQILTFCLGNEPRSRVRRRLGVAENTLKTQIRALLRKCEERSVDALAKNVLRAALLGAHHASAEPISPWLPLDFAESA